MKRTTQPSAYRAFLLRFWAEEAANHTQRIIRFSLETTEDRQVYGFQDLQTLIDFLRDEVKQFDDDFPNPSRSSLRKTNE